MNRARGKKILTRTRAASTGEVFAEVNAAEGISVLDSVDGVALGQDFCERLQIEASTGADPLGGKPAAIDF